jgi:hypothetical protein
LIKNQTPSPRAGARIPALDENEVKYVLQTGAQSTFPNKNSFKKGCKSLAKGDMVPEDPYVWRDRRGNFHMLFNANSGHGHCQPKVPCGGHAWSKDGLTWSQPSIPSFGPIIHYVDNSTTTFDYVERPQIVQEADGTPLTLYVGHGYGNVNNLAIMFCQEGDTDCVTTIQ